MADFVETVGIKEIITAGGHEPSGNFKAIYDQIYREQFEQTLNELDAAVRRYFS